MSYQLIQRVGPNQYRQFSELDSIKNTKCK